MTFRTLAHLGLLPLLYGPSSAWLDPFRLGVENDCLEAFGLIALLLILGGIVLAWPLRRVSRKLGDALSLVAHFAARLAIIVIVGYSGVRAVEHGTLPYVALGVLLFVLAAGAVVMSVVFLIALVQTLRGDPDGADLSGERRSPQGHCRALAHADVPALAARANTPVLPAIAARRSGHIVETLVYTRI